MSIYFLWAEKAGNLAKIDCVLLTNALYDQDFDNYQETSDFFTKFASIQDAVKEIALYNQILGIPSESLFISIPFLKVRTMNL